jgi:thymidylate kinase
MTTLRRGIFIVFEGIDRCGKTTQAHKLAQFMQQNNLPCEHIRFPGTTFTTLNASHTISPTFVHNSNNHKSSFL